MGPTGEALRVLQVHPTRRCNLRCLHCYSASGPEVREEIPLAPLLATVESAAIEGYNVLGCSGGEPVLYSHLAELLSHARALGMITTVTSNGMLLDEARLEALAGRTSVLAISLDGKPESHDLMRGRMGAFAAMEANLPAVRASKIPFGFIFTLTQQNLHELEWVTEFAIAQGAALLQIHPLEIAGRAAETLSSNGPDAFEGTAAYLVVERLRSTYGCAISFQLDLLHREVAESEPSRVLAADLDHEESRPLSDLLSPLVLEADGTLVPVQYGFSRAFALGSIHQDDLSTLAARWRQERLPAFRALCREALSDLKEGSPLPFRNWYEVLARRARMATNVPSAV
jgi:sulfatase maturation enzyme AslB (radical SAM superfamily)